MNCVIAHRVCMCISFFFFVLWKHSEITPVVDRVQTNELHFTNNSTKGM